MLSSVNKLLIIGPDVKGKGGIASVIQTFLQADSCDYKISTINTYCTGNGKYNYILFLHAIYRLTLRLLFNKPDVIYLHTASKGSFYRKSILVLICKLFKRKVILHLHGGGFKPFYSNSSKLLKKYIEHIFLITNRVVVLSEHWQVWLLNNVNESLNITVLRNGVKNSQSTSIPLLKKQFVYVGRLVTGKGLEDLFQSIVLLKKDGQVFNTIIAGEGDTDFYISLANKLDIQDYLTFKGWVSRRELDALITESIALILPSYAEGMPMCILEAFANKRPVISTTVGSIPEILIHNQDGFLFEPGVIDDLITYMNLYLNDLEKAQEHGLNGYYKYESDFSDYVFIRNSYEIINSLINAE